MCVPFLTNLSVVFFLTNNLFGPVDHRKFGRALIEGKFGGVSNSSRHSSRSLPEKFPYVNGQLNFVDPFLHSLIINYLHTLMHRYTPILGI